MSNSSTDIDYSYDSDGLRTSKNVNGVTTKYEYLGGNLVQMERGSNKLRFTYDALGASGVIFNGTYYYYEKNAQGDILGIVDKNRNFVVNYNYDAWGTLLSTTGSMANTLGELNPLRYRGYVYDNETNFYYLQSRYYNPAMGRFINADSIVDTEQGLNSTNMFAYCGNNPVIRKDTSGRFFETVFDIVTLAMSVIDVVKNPGDIGALAGLAGDLVDLLPFITGVGETTKAINIANKVVDKAVEINRASNKFSETALKFQSVASKGILGERIAGISKTYDKITISPKKYRIPDQYDEANKILHEVKNYSGTLCYTKQLQDYVAYAKQHGYKIYLHTDAKLSWRLQQQVDLADSIFEIIPFN